MNEPGPGGEKRSAASANAWEIVWAFRRTAFRTRSSTSRLLNAMNFGSLTCEALWESFLRRYPNPKEAMQVRSWQQFEGPFNSTRGAVRAAAANSTQLARKGLAAVPEAADAGAAGDMCTAHVVHSS